jgi:hypothetical protein
VIFFRSTTESAASPLHETRQDLCDATYRDEWDDVQYERLVVVASVGQTQPGLSSEEMVRSSFCSQSDDGARWEGMRREGSRFGSRDSL